MSVFPPLKRVVTYLRLIFTGRVNGAAIVTGLLCIIILIGVDQINGLLRKYVRKFPLHIPAQLIVVSILTHKFCMKCSFIKLFDSLYNYHSYDCMFVPPVPLCRLF